MQKAKALIWLFPENIRSVEKQADSCCLGGGCSGNSRWKTWGLISLSIRALPHDLVTGGIPHGGPWQIMLKVGSGYWQINSVAGAESGSQFCTLMLSVPVNYSHSGRLSHSLNLILAKLSHRCFVWSFSSCSEQGLLFVTVHRLLIAVVFLVAEHGL